MNWPARVEIDANGCWNWKGPISKEGYGRLGPRLAHRVSYQEAVGPIPQGLVLDHLCKNKKCANPKHLEAVTQRVNVLRSDGPATRRSAQTHCGRGHLLAGSNIRSYKRARRTCIACMKINGHERYLRERISKKPYKGRSK